MSPNAYVSDSSGEPEEPPRSTSDPEYYIPMREAGRLNGKADQLKAHAESIARHNGELYDLVETLAGGGNGSWQGHRADTFWDTWVGVNGQVTNWVININNTADRLYSEAAALRRQAENYLAGG